MQLGWIFSRRLDLILFWGPLLFALAFAYLPHIDSIDFIVNVLIADQIFNWTHVLATSAPMARLQQIGRITKIKIFMLILMIGLGGFAIFHFQKKVFYVLLAYTALTHILRQQYGWIMVSRRKAGEPEETRMMDVIETWNIFLFPIIYWHTGLAQIAKTYFIADDLAIQIPPQIILPLQITHWILHIGYFYALWKKPKMRNPSKLSLMGMSWLWLYGSLVILENAAAFWICLLIVHGAPYIYYSHLRNKNFVPFSAGITKIKPWVLFAIQIFILGIVWRGIGWTALHYDRESDWVFLVWWPLLCHYAFDKFIWTSRVERPTVAIEGQ